ncbi:fimbria/pilus chaperone family protein [Pseudomonas sp.]|uniref:fimbria/pilus chaperone family protein n=1 Tax=Pseudomonas sp. TaxID=306 RepID=UPI003CC6D0DD
MRFANCVTFFHLVGFCLSPLLATSVVADGMIPETSVIIVDEAEGEASIRVTNSDSRVALLHVTLENVPEDTQPLVFVTPPVSRVEAGQEQLVRFILRNDQPLKTQRLKRVIFEGISQNPGAPVPGEARVGVTVRQNLPVILHPKGLAAQREPWLGLRWRLVDGALTVANDTAYVVRLAQELRLMPGDIEVQLPRSYLLPGDHLSLAVASAVAATHVRLQPATVYGFAVDAYEAPLHGYAP